jgi:hypothetical protein
MTDMTKWCAGALPGGAPTHQGHEKSLKALAANALRELECAPSPHQTEMVDAPDQWCTGASGAGGAGGAADDIRAVLKGLAKRLGIPVATVDQIGEVDLKATAEQLAKCKGHLDGDGNPLASSLLRFYLNALASLPAVTRTV